MNYELRIKNFFYSRNLTVKILLSCCLAVLLSVFLFSYASADSILTGKVDCEKSPGDEACTNYKTGNYQLDDFVKIAINITAWILSITGSLSLLFFIYGGTMLLISGGSQERVTKAKNILSGAVIGAVIVLTSFIIINFLITSLRGDSAKEWYKLTTK